MTVSFQLAVGGDCRLAFAAYTGRIPASGGITLNSLILRAVAAVLLAVPGAAAVAQPAPPPIEAYASLPALSNVAISPDGSRIAFIGQVGENRRLGIRALNGEALGVVDLGEQKVRAVSWADNRHVLITTSEYTDIAFIAESSEYYNAQIYDVEDRTFVTVLDSSRGGSGTTSTRIGGGAGMLNIIAGAPFVRLINGEPRTFARSYTRDGGIGVFEINLDTGAGTLREDFGGVMGPDGRAVARSNWDTERGRWWVSARRRVGFEQIWTSLDNMIETPSLLGYGRTEDTVLISVPGDARDELYELPLAGGEPLQLTFDGEGEASPLYNGHTGRLMGFEIAGENDFEYIYIDEVMGRAWAAASAPFADRLVSLASATPDRSRLIVFTEGGADTGTYHLVDLIQGRATRIGSAYPDVPTEAIGEVRWISYEAGDGMRIPAYLTLPPGREPEALPLIVMPHGGPQARDMPGFEYWAQLLASRGYAVLQPQFRGSVGFGNAHFEAGFGEWGRRMQTDLSDGVRHLAAEGLIDPERVCIWGWSYGGYAAMAGPTIDPGVYRCAAAGAGVSDLPRMLAWERDRTGGRDTIIMRYWKRFMGADRINDGSLNEVSPARMARHADVPILLIHGRDDSVVPYEQTQYFADALRREGKNVEVVDLQGEDHWLSRRSGRLAVFQALIPFLEEHNPPD